MDRIAQLCGRLPSALRVVGDCPMLRSGWSADHSIRRLVDGETRLAPWQRVM
ncbi:hypothetical protein H0H10_06390 [Streptomyces sp. TRM S81-3]|uniref:Uncharacterized protein n=1 Tax=Streptomyces griseicoloratus TaxID=2752516 RepID=A0A926QP02_9ACTN|nr:hypothetical protein [Streptomyces griseicoloratus]MBD0418808.1 hypothetical protein [Streptomyces griseicoloratus]